jgi:hypothetical protein
MLAYLIEFDFDNRGPLLLHFTSTEYLISGKKGFTDLIGFGDMVLLLSKRGFSFSGGNLAVCFCFVVDVKFSKRSLG